MEGELSDGEVLEGSAELITSGEHTTKIKKKAIVAEDDIDDTRSLSQEASNYDVSSDVIKAQEVKARQDLIDFLIRKSIDPKAADDYHIHVKQNRQKSRRYELVSPGGSSFTYSFTYSGPDSSILASKSDVLSHIQERKSRQASKGSRASNGGQNQFVPRDEAYETALQRLADKIHHLEEPFPMRITSNLEVLSLGAIDCRPGFHTPVQIYPIGYKCKQVISGLSYYKGFPTQNIICEINENEGYPEFRIMLPGTGTTFLASSEANVWKKVSFG